MSMEFTLDFGALSTESIAIATNELRETPERRTEAVLKLKELLHADPTLNFSDDEEFLLIFLRPCKFYPESAYELMKRVADFKKSYADILDNLMPDDLKTQFTEYDVVNVLKENDHKGRRVLMVNIGGTWDPKKVNSDQIFRMFYMIHMAAMLEPETQVRGVVVIMNCENMSMSQVTGLTPSFAVKLLTFIQDAMPLRLKEIHFIREPWVFSIVWNLFKPFIKQKLKSRIHFHKNNMKNLHKFLEPSHLPADFGGLLPAIDYSGKEWYPALLAQLDDVKAWNTYGYVKDDKDDKNKK